MDGKKIIVIILLIVAFLTSIYVGINIYSKNNSLMYDLVFNKHFSIIDIALSRSEETVFRSQIISMLLYLFIMIPLLRLKSNSYLIYIFSGIILLNIIFEIYCINLVSGGTYSGQHLRLNTVMFVIGLFLLKENKKSLKQK